MMAGIGSRPLGSCPDAMTGPLSRARSAVVFALGVFAVALCWEGVGWAFRRGDAYLYGDEIGNLTLYAGVSYRQILHLFPEWIYNDRPLGIAVERLLFDMHGLRYAAQLRYFLAIHFANLAMAFFLYRRLRLSTPLSIAVVGLAGSVTPTAATATYLGAVFDVLCLFFLLGSTLTLFGNTRQRQVASALLFLLALRTKEIAIMAPLIFTVLVLYRIPWRGFGQAAAGAARALWLHYLIAIVFAIRYSSFLPRMRASVPASDPYYLDVRLGTAVKSLAYYTGCIFGIDEFLSRHSAAVVLGFAAVLVYALLRRSGGIVFGIAAYLLLLLPVLFLGTMRSLYYVYGPQFFLVLAACLLIQDAMVPIRRERARWTAAVVVAVAILALAVGLRRSFGFRSEIWFTWTVRSICGRTARDVAARLPGLQPDTHVYVSHGPDRPWLLAQGPCDYLNLIARTRSISCFLGDPNSMAAAYTADPVPRKLLLDYARDGSFTVER